MEDNKIFVFLSHSHHDYEKVRVVRDLLEKEGFRPLMFFLKCLEKEGYEELTRTLIKEEIDSRQRFVLCNSKNADESDWVKFEVKHIKETNRPYEVVDLDWPNNKIADVIKRFKIRSTVFLSYPRRLTDLANKVNQQLKLRDFKTFFDKDDLMVGDSFSSKIIDQINIAVTEGYFLVFVDENFNENTWQYEEIQTALRIQETIAGHKNQIIPIITSDNVTDLVKKTLGHISYIKVSNKSSFDAAEYIVDQLIKLDIKNYQD
ncbi:MAG: toll/interleukin-1 receptor domain-containing protein [Bacteroidales bacterium]|nr:toll/interleukin-1 receptor domain-containing protein [Bacteroidales bacterium]